ncbi:Isoleucine--tRNA ligase [Rickettsiales bacterium Ac37b]|nr:Isoleucine--tRNA ligase [Rickettsiales bacterium Ac37b]
MNTEKLYPQVDSNPSFAAIEEKILKFWQQNNIFQASIDQRNHQSEFVFYDGPPFANGLPHYGHLLTGFMKDLIARYQTMQSKRVERRFGWDCHGLPAEMAVEKELQLSGYAQIVEFGIEKFNKQCATSVLRYTSEWEQYVNRQGRWVDLENDYKTMDTDFMESVLWAFKQLYGKGLIYESMRVMPYSWACEAPLSNFETRLDNSYRERTDKAITVTFTLNNRPQSAPEGCKAYKVLAWTTTPWTLPSNLALAVNKDIKYVYIVKNEECFIIAETLYHKYTKELGLDKENPPNISLGEELIGLTYEPLFPYFSHHDNAFKILEGEFVTEHDGTGIVHMAPGFGEDDYVLCTKHNISIVCPVDSRGKFTREVSDYAGMLVFDAIDEIIKSLKLSGHLIKIEQFVHNYPHCWRTDTPLIYKALPSWYVEVTKIKEQLIKNNQQINWVPEHVKNGLFGKWLENVRDWSISRNRFWGTPIPVWKSDNPLYPRIDVYGSIEELEKDFKVKIDDLHKPFIDTLTRPNPDDPSGKSMMVRVTDVFDCWFESGSMPYAQIHYPFENKERFEKNFPADFIVEYSAQTRGWFYTLLVLSTALFDKPPFLNCVCHGVILDEKGQKLSKRLNNYQDPMEIFATFGADALRFFMMSSPVMRGQELLIDKEGRMLKDTIRLVIKPIWNSYNFFTLYANADNIKAVYSVASPNIMDQYILSKTQEVVTQVIKALDNYDTPSSCALIQDFFEILTNWYIRRNRNRFWKTNYDDDKQHAYNTLYTVLNIMCKVCAPLLPFITEEIYLGLETGGKLISSSSVHLTNFPTAQDIRYDAKLVSNMDRTRDICSSILAVRNNNNIKTRTPLEEATVLGANVIHLTKFVDLIKDETNIKQLNLSENIDDQASFKLQLNFTVLGKRLPNKIKELITASKANNWYKDSDSSLEIAGEKLNNDEFNIILAPKNTQNSMALSSNDALVTVNLNITEDLKLEGMARDLVRLIQQSRKEANLNISDRIALNLTTDSELSKAISQFSSYIGEQTLSTLMLNKKELQQDFTYKYEHILDNDKVIIEFSVMS